jgi:ribosomal protein S18 acetylase RimI-like enzyme
MKKIQTTVEREHATKILTDAFKTDPLTNYISSSDNFRSAFFNITVKHLAQHTYLLDDNAVAVWYKSGEVNRKSFWQYIKSPISFCQMLYYASQEKLKEMTDAMGRVEKINKQKLEGVPHYYYIYFLGVDPPRQGQRLGSRMLEEITSKADQENLPVLLEASSERNRKLYILFGFEEFNCLAMKGDPSVKVWLMLRPAKSK